MAFVAQAPVVAAISFAATTMVLQPLGGAWLVHQAGPPWSTRWLGSSLLLFGIAAPAWLHVVQLQLRMRRLAREAVALRTDSAGFVALLCFPAIFYLMVVKPGLDRCRAVNEPGLALTLRRRRAATIDARAAPAAVPCAGAAR